MVKKKDDEIHINPKNSIAWIIIGLLIIIIAMLWIEKDFTFIEVIPEPEQRFVFECYCEFPTCKEPVDWDWNITWYQSEIHGINFSEINRNNLPIGWSK